MSRRRPGRGRGGPGAVRWGGITFRHRELRDLLVAWLALSLAFTILFTGGGFGFVDELTGDPVRLLSLLAASLLTAGLGFVLHELAHKVVAVRFGQTAEFRAAYQWLAIALAASLAGFIFAAPGAVHHSGRITKRQRGLIALAGPLANHGLALVFVVPLLAGAAAGEGPLFLVGLYGTAINLLLAGFNMLPIGPLDGGTVRAWDQRVYLLVAVPSVLLGAGAFLLI